MKFYGSVYIDKHVDVLGYDPFSFMFLSPTTLQFEICKLISSHNISSMCSIYSMYVCLLQTVPYQHTTPTETQTVSSIIVP